jgi:hypothetical protein
MLHTTQTAETKAEVLASPGIFEMLDHICRVERVSFRELKSIQILDNEISVQFVRPGGAVRISTYPLGGLAAVIGEDADLPFEIR